MADSISNPRNLPRQLKIAVWLTYLMAFFALACSSGSSHQAGEEPRFEEDASVDAGESLDVDWDTTAHDKDPLPPPGSVLVRILEELRLCQSQGEITLPSSSKSIVTLPTGQYLLSFGQDQMEGELFETVSTDGNPANAQGPGAFRVQCFGENIDQIDICIFGYSKPYRVLERDLLLQFDFWVDVRGSRILDLPKGLSGNYYTCDDILGYTTASLTAQVENNDEIFFSYFYFDTCQNHPPYTAGLCPAYVGDILEGKLIRGQASVVATDYYKLHLRTQHHGFPDFFHMVFDEPLGEIHGLALDHSHPGLPKILYLNHNLETMAEASVTLIEYY